MGRLNETVKYSWYYPLAVAVVVAAGALATAYTYQKVDSIVKESFLGYVTAVANALEPKNIATLSGTENDITSADYVALKERLGKIKELNGGIRYAYLAGYRNGVVFFFADSEPKDSLGYAPPGLIYSNATLAMRRVFVTKTPVMEDVFSDSKGVWVSALAPIIDPQSGKVIAVLGMDVSASLYHQMVLIYSILPGILTAFVVILFIIGYLISRRERRFFEFKSELVSIASHEIRTPLTGISWITEGLLQQPGNLSDEQKKDIEMIDDQSKNLLSTINDLLDLSAVEKIGSRKLKKQKIAILPFFQKLAEGFQLSLREKSLRLILDKSLASSVSIIGEEDRLRRMFNNLISNAIKYSKQNGIITAGVAFKNKSAVFWIEDQGIGIPKKDLIRIFSGFYRSENAKQATENGTGLGLRYVEQIAELHHGRVWCESEENKGSTFFVELPI
jgi:signal transduction histidine kinase